MGWLTIFAGSMPSVRSAFIRAIRSAVAPNLDLVGTLRNSGRRIIVFLQFDTLLLNFWWVTNSAYIRAKVYWLYLIIVVSLFYRRVIGLRLSYRAPLINIHGFTL